jgi:hypothetical protein
MRSQSQLKSSIAVVVAILLLHLPVLGANAPVGKVVPTSGASQLNGNALVLETTLFSGDNVATQVDGLAVILLPQGDQVHLGPASSARLTETGDSLVVSLERGMTLTRSGHGRNVSVNAVGVLVRPAGLASYEVAIDGGAILVASREGSVEVQGTNESFVVPAGKAMKFELAANTAPGPIGAGAHNISPGVAAVVAIAVSAGVGIPVSFVLADRAEDNAREDACNLIRSQVSPSIAAQITCN